MKFLIRLSLALFVSVAFLAFFVLISQTYAMQSEMQLEKQLEEIKINPKTSEIINSDSNIGQAIKDVISQRVYFMQECFRNILCQIGALNYKTAVDEASDLVSAFFSKDFLEDIGRTMLSFDDWLRNLKISDDEKRELVRNVFIDGFKMFAQDKDRELVSEKVYLRGRSNFVEIVTKYNLAVLDSVKQAIVLSDDTKIKLSKNIFIEDDSDDSSNNDGEQSGKCGVVKLDEVEKGMICLDISKLFRLLKTVFDKYIKSSEFSELFVAFYENPDSDLQSCDEEVEEICDEEVEESFKEAMEGIYDEEFGKKD